MAGISAGMLADDIGRVTGIRTEARTVSSHKDIPEGAAVIAGTLGHSGLADWIVRKNRINTDGIEGKVTMVDGLGYSDGVIEIRTLPTLHVYEGRDARYAVQTGDDVPQTFSIHAGDFTAEWRRNVLHGYSSRKISLPENISGKLTFRVYFLDPGIVLQEILVK